MNAIGRRWVTVLVCAVVVVVGFSLAKRSDITRELAFEQAAVSAAAAQLTAAEQDASEWEELLGERRATSAIYDGLLHARTDFVAALAGLTTAFAGAAGKVDTGAQRSAVVALQDQVTEERKDAAVVTAAAAEVRRVSDGVVKAVADYEAQQAALAAAARVTRGAASAAATVAVGGYSRIRAALDRVGGSHVPLLAYDGMCGSVQAAACADSGGVILFTGAVAGYSDSRLHWVMAHELAHISQFGVWNAMTASPGYASLFGGDPELLANCMAQQRGYPSGTVVCSGAQLDWGAAIWQRRVPG